jgi:hypothetical protein
VSQTVDSFLALRRVCLVVAYDNGKINREQDEQAFLRSTDEVFGAEGVDYADLANMNIFCQMLSDEEVQTLAAGEYDEIQAIIARAEAWMPGLGPKLDGLLNDVFDRPADGSYRPVWVTP